MKYCHPILTVEFSLYNLSHLASGVLQEEDLLKRDLLFVQWEGKMRRIQYIETIWYRTPAKNTLLETDRDNQSSFTLRRFTHLSINCLSVYLSVLGLHKNRGEEREKERKSCLCIDKIGRAKQWNNNQFYLAIATIDARWAEHRHIELIAVCIQLVAD